MRIKARVGKGEPIEFDYPIGDTLDELTDQFGNEYVASSAKANIVIGIQGYARSLVAKGDLKGKALIDKILEHKPGTRKPKKPVHEKFKEMLSKISEEEKAAMLAELGVSMNPNKKATTAPATKASAPKKALRR